MIHNFIHNGYIMTHIYILIYRYLYGTHPDIMIHNYIHNGYIMTHICIYVMTHIYMTHMYT